MKKENYIDFEITNKKLRIPKSFFTPELSIYSLSVLEIKLLLYFISDRQSAIKIGIQEQILNVMNGVNSYPILTKMFNRNKSKIVTAVKNIFPFIKPYIEYENDLKYYNHLKELVKTKEKEYKIYRDKTEIVATLGYNEFVNYLKNNVWKDDSRYYSISHKELILIMTNDDIGINELKLIILLIVNNYRAINNGWIQMKSCDIVKELNMRKMEYVNFTSHFNNIIGHSILREFKIEGNGTKQIVKLKLLSDKKERALKNEK